MDKHFTHLHLHTEYSLLDGAIRLEQLVEYGKQHQLKALAMTDHGNIFGAVKFFQLAKKAVLNRLLVWKPISLKMLLSEMQITNITI